MSNKNIKEEQRMIPIMINNIKEKGLLEDILNDSELKKEALTMLGRSEKSVEEILKDVNMKNEIIIRLNNELTNQIKATNQKLIEDNNSLKKSVEELGDKKSELEKSVKEKEDLQQKLEKIKIEIEELEKDKQELELSTEDLKNLRAKIIQKNEEKHLLLGEISNKEIEKNVLEENIKSLKTQKGDLKFDISNFLETTRKEQEEFKQKIISFHEEETKKEIEKLNKQIEELKETKKSKEDLLKKESVLELKEKELNEKEENIRNREENINEVTKEAREEEKRRREEEISGLEKELRDLNEKNIDAKNEIRRLQNINADSFSKEELNDRIGELEKIKGDLEAKLLGKGDLQTQEIKTLKGKIETLEKEHTKVTQENIELYNKNIDFIKYKDKLEVVERALPELERSKESLIALLEKREDEISELKSRQMSEEAKKETIEQAYFTIEEKEDKEAEEITDEIKWLNKIKNSFKEVGFKFSDRLLYAFHTSLKVGDWNPLTVLAGVSGTGKSELPRLYSRYGGINFLPLAVQSNWDSPYSLFGYYNSLEGKFNATSLLKVLYQAQEDAKNSISDYLTIVLLDEMNLAHVELYFSELLSKLELLRGSDEVKLEIDIAEKNPYEIKLNKNIIWVGTMNEDETTKSLSDKVIDRSNLINFPRPNKFVSRNELKELEEAPKLKRELWESWKWNDVKNMLMQNETTKEENIKIITDFEDKVDDLKEKMEEINGYLKFSGRAIGHRVWQSIENYIRNYPLVLESIRNRNSEELKKAIQIAFEDALVQKLMPKLKGLETEGLVREKCLNDISSKIQTYANGIASDFDNSLNNPYGVFVWNSSEYLLGKSDK